MICKVTHLHINLGIPIGHHKVLKSKTIVQAEKMRNKFDQNLNLPHNESDRHSGQNLSIITTQQRLGQMTITNS